MTYRAMRRVIPKKLRVSGDAERSAFLDGCLKEGTDRGWTLHSWNEAFDVIAEPSFTSVWETND
jgi:hypothetical protein